MFMIRLSPTFSIMDSVFDIDLPQVPAVGDTILASLDTVETVFRVKARQFDITFLNGEQVALDRPQVLLHVEQIS